MDDTAFANLKQRTNTLTNLARTPKDRTAPHSQITHLNSIYNPHSLP